MDKPSENIESVKSVAEYLEAVANLTDSLYGRYAFRGQSKISYPINSSAARRLKIFQSNTDEKQRFIDYNNTLLSNAMLKGYHRKGIVPLEELELLAELQHNGAATCLIDFTYSSLVALYFAVSSTDMNAEDGAVYILNTRDSEKYIHIQSNDITRTISNLFAQIDGKLWVWEPSDLNNRIPKQHSVFIFGQPEITKHEVGTIKINKDAKFGMLGELTKLHDISADTLFNDLTGFSKENASDKPFYTPELIDKMEKFFSVFLSDDDSDPKACIELLDQILNLNKNSYAPLLLRSKFKLRIEDYQGAIEDLDIILKLQPDDYETYHSRGIAKFYLNDYKGAQEDFKAAIKIRPGFVRAHNFLKMANEKIMKEKAKKTQSS